MSRNEIVAALNGRVNSGDVECIVNCLRVVTFAGWQRFGYSATKKSKVEFKDFGWTGWESKCLTNYAKRSRRRDLSVKELNYAIKMLPKYTAQVAELISKEGFYARVEEAFSPITS